MNKLNKYLTKNEIIIYNKLVKNYDKFNYDDDEDLILDLNFLLSVKFKNTKVYKNKTNLKKGKEFNFEKYYN